MHNYSKSVSIPSQKVPLPVNPTRQLHKCPPTVLMHMARLLQSLVSVEIHSFMSSSQRVPSDNY